MSHTPADRVASTVDAMLACALLVDTRVVPMMTALFLAGVAASHGTADPALTGLAVSAAAATLCYACRPGSRLVLTLSGLLVVGSLTAEAAAAAGLLGDPVDIGPACVSALAALFAAWVWARVLRPVTTLLAARPDLTPPRPADLLG